MQTVSVKFEISDTAIDRYRERGGLTVAECTPDDIARTIVHDGLTEADCYHALGAASQTWKVLGA